MADFIYYHKKKIPKIDEKRNVYFFIVQKNITNRKGGILYPSSKRQKRRKDIDLVKLFIQDKQNWKRNVSQHLTTTSIIK